MQSSRESLLRMLEGMIPRDPKEADDLAQMKRWAAELENPFSREQLPAHFTGSALILSPDGERVCLIFHAKAKGWLQPGGHAELEDGGSLVETTLREAREETGLQVSLHPRFPHPIHVDTHQAPAGGAEHRHLDIRFVLVAMDPDALRYDPNESHAAIWLSIEEASRRAADDSVRRLIEAARQQGVWRTDA